MSKDPAFLFYPGDASNDTQFMNRLERGAYFDLVKSQRLFHGYTTVQLRKILGKDYDEVWPVLELVLKKEDGIYFIEWLRESICKRDNYNQKQSERIKKRWLYHGNTVVLPKIENENENNKEGGIGGNNGFIISDPKILFGEMNQEQYRMHVTTSSYKKNLSETDFCIKLKEYIEIQRDTEELNRSLRDYKKHFIAWLRKN